MRPAYTIEGDLLYTKSTDPKNTLTETSRMTFDQISRYHDLANLMHKINHYNIYVGFSKGKAF